MVVGVFFEFIRDYIFVNLNLQMQFLHYQSLDLDSTNYTDSFVLLFINSLRYSTIANLKWVFALLFSIIFFVLITIAALSSAISLLEPFTAWMEELLKIKRKIIVIFIGLFVWLLGIGSIFSFNIWSDLRFMNLNFLEFYY